MPWRSRLSLGAALLALAFMTGTAAAEAFSAHGSAEQVYATGLGSKARASLLNSKGQTVGSKRATGRGGLLFRHVKPGSGYRVSSGGSKSAPLRVLSTKAAPPSRAVYTQTTPTKGYGYMTMRDGTKLAINVPPPQDVTDVLPTGGLPGLP